MRAVDADTSSEDELVASSQETVAVKTSAEDARDLQQQNSPHDTVNIGDGSTKTEANRYVAYRKLEKKRRSTGVLINSQCQKTAHILSKID